MDRIARMDRGGKLLRGRLEQRRAEQTHEIDARDRRTRQTHETDARDRRDEQHIRTAHTNSTA